jgi:hypothetical protein
MELGMKLPDIRPGTQRVETRGLAKALQQLFPRHEFYPLLELEPRPGVDARIYAQTNTSPVSIEREAEQEARARAEGKASVRMKLIQALAGAVYPPSRMSADLVIALDDLELCNLDRPGVVVGAIRASVKVHLEEQRRSLHPAAFRELASCLRERASFHLAVPMTEVWLFADPKGPANSGVSDPGAVHLKADIDPEQFETDDPEYTADTGEGCTQLQERNRKTRKNKKASWVLSQQPWRYWQREYHPKAYLQWLCRDPKENNCTRWKETEQGADALEKLDWAASLAAPDKCSFLRSLINDLADALGEQSPVEGECAPLTAYKPDDPDAVLRNM